jgi:hypothetical protein
MIRAMIEAVRTSETSVHFDVTTWRYIPEDSLHTRRRENLKSHIVVECFNTPAFYSGGPVCKYQTGDWLL